MVDEMDQTRIWEYFQNHDEAGELAFNAQPRYRFLARQIGRNKKVLNIGVGRGGLEELLVAAGVDISCVDPSEKSIERLRQKLRLAEKAQAGWSQNLPFADRLFDVVVMSEVLEHLDRATMTQTLFEVRRVLARGGCLIGTVPHREQLLENTVMCPCCGKRFHRWGHVQSFSKAGVSEVLRAAEFEIVRLETRAFPDWTRRSVIGIAKSIAKYFLGRIGDPRAYPSIFFIAQRN